MRLLLLGYGKMGRLVESLAPQYGGEVVGVVDPLREGDGVDADKWAGVDVAIDFTTADAVPVNMLALAPRGINMVVGTTGWGSRQPELRRVVSEAGIGVVVAPNFSTGVVLFEALVGSAARMFSMQSDFGAFIHESHHAAKKDAPSGTALLLKNAMEASGYSRSIDVASTRAGHVPGTHTIGFDGPAETVTLTHTARDRTAFARGALAAAGWIKGRRGWYTMHDVLGLRPPADSR